MLLKEQYQVLVKSLLPYAQKELGFKNPPKINFVDDQDNSKNPLGKTAYYHPEDKEITIFITNRHPKDILRSVAHELVHYKQDEDGRLTQSMKQDLHDKNYTQHNANLRKFEEEAYLNGNMIFRDWEDNYKNGPKQIIKITKESKQMNESNIRATIKRLVAEIIAEEKEKKEEEEKLEVSQVRDSAEKSLKARNIMREDTESISLKEWKNQELFGLLSNKFFGVNLTEKKQLSAKDKKLAAMYPPKDKITRGDVIAAAKAGEMGEDAGQETPEEEAKREKKKASERYKESEYQKPKKPKSEYEDIQERKLTPKEKKTKTFTQN